MLHRRGSVGRCVGPGRTPRAAPHGEAERSRVGRASERSSPVHRAALLHLVDGARQCLDATESSKVRWDSVRYFVCLCSIMTYYACMMHACMTMCPWASVVTHHRCYPWCFWGMAESVLQSGMTTYAVQPHADSNTISAWPYTFRWIDHIQHALVFKQTANRSCIQGVCPKKLSRPTNHERSRGSKGFEQQDIKRKQSPTPHVSVCVDTL